MKVSEHLLINIILLFLEISCKNSVNNENPETKHIPYSFTNASFSENPENVLQIDSIIDHIQFIPLETNPACLITDISKAIIDDDKLYIHDGSDRLLVFDINGKFLRQIGRQGRGPGEYSELRDIDISEDKLIYTLDFEKIHQYDQEGRYIKSFNYRFSPEDEILCNPLQFALKDKNHFYIWGGSFGIDNNSEGKYFALYTINKAGLITGRYFPLKHRIPANTRCFYRNKDTILLRPIFGSNEIYGLNKEGLFLKYKLDFGSRNLKFEVPNEFQSLREFRIRIENDAYHSIGNVTESDNWLYFTFQYKSVVYNAFYNRRTKSSFLSRQQPFVDNQIVPWMIMGAYNNTFFSLLDPKHFLEAYNMLSGNKAQKYFVPNLTDNPILVICYLK